MNDKRESTAASTRYGHGGPAQGSQDQGERKDRDWQSRQGGGQSRDRGSTSEPGRGPASNEGEGPPPGRNTQGELAGIGKASDESPARDDLEPNR